MTASTLPTAPLTDHVLSVVATLGFPVGDAAPPEIHHGWRGEPNATGSNFTPWITVMPGQAGVSSGPLGASQADWRIPYYFTLAGVRRKQTELLSDKLRQLLVAQARVKVPAGSDTWSIQQVRVASIGGMNRQSTTSPSYYLQTDTVEFWYSKELI